MLRVRKVDGEATRFHVESGSWQCTRCDEVYGMAHRPNLRLGDVCPKCLKAADAGNLKGPAGKMDHRWHLVDIAAFNRNGQCSCEFFHFAIGPELRRMTDSEQGSCAKWCGHIAAARRFALDVALLAHEKERYADAGRRREEGSDVDHRAHH